MTYKEFQNLVGGTNTHTVDLIKDEKSFIGVYNGLSFWGKVFAVDGDTYNQVELVQSEFDEEDRQPYDFREADFIASGYTIKTDVEQDEIDLYLCEEADLSYAN